jgi:amino acid adenylation domain-containing protein
MSLPLTALASSANLLAVREAEATSGAGLGAAEIDWLPLNRQALDHNGPVGRSYASFDPNRVNDPIIDLVRRVSEREPDRIAVSDGVQQLSYRELLSRALRCAENIAAMVAPGDAIAILLPNGVAHPVAVLACLAAGCPCIVLDRDYPEDRNRAIIEHSGAKAVVLSPGESAPGAITAIRLNMKDTGAAEPLGSIRITPAAPDAPAVIIYTSGSTGQPKGIALSQRALLHRAGQLINSLHLGPADRTLPLGSPCTVAGLLQTLEALLTGATLVKANVRALGIRGVLDLIAHEQVTAIFATPALLRALCRSDGARAGLASLRCVHPSGDVLLSADLDLIWTAIPDDCLIMAAYGLTEAPVICQWFVPRDVIEPGRVPVGYPVPGYACAIIGETGRPVDDGVPGELVVRSRFTALGEWCDGKVLAGSLYRDAADPSMRVLHTGDLVRRHADGSMTVLGRKDRQIQIRGMRVEPYEIECALRRSPAVVDAAVIPREDAGETSLAAFIVPAARGEAGTVSLVRRHLAEILPSQMQPSRILAVDNLPLLPGYKIDVEALRALDRSPEPPSPAAEPDPPARQGFALRNMGEPADGSLIFGRDLLSRLREIVTEAWCRALGRDSLQEGITFAEAGGDSLRLLTFVFELEMQLRISLPLTNFELDMTAHELEHATRAALDDAMSAPLQCGASPAVLLKSGAKHPPIFIASGLGAHPGGVRILAKYLAPEHSVFALQPVPLGGGQVPHEVAEFAAQYVAAIIEIQPHGPYILVGYSLGGLIMYEAARILQNKGEPIALLALLDSYPHHRFWPVRPRLALLAERSWHRLRPARRPRLREILPYVASNLARMVRDLAALPSQSAQPPAGDWYAPSATLRQIRLGLLKALARYRGARYDGNVVFFRPETRWLRKTPKDPRSVWRPLVGEMAVVTVPGNHHTMCSIYSGTLAAALDRCIENALVRD